jgi:ABC-type transport system substrate-binding protein
MRSDNYWTRRLPRRRVLAGAGAGGVGVAGLVLAGCGDDDNKTNGNSGGGSTPAPTGGATPQASATLDVAKVPKDGILNSRQTAPYASINPYKGLDSGLLWGFTIYDHLWYTPLDTGIRENFLATSIEQQDPLHFTVKMGDSVFHNKAPINGRAVKASDVKASYESAAKQTAISASSWWTQTLDRVDALDDHTVNFTLKTVDAWTFTSLNGGSPIGSSILPEEMAKDPSLMDTNLVGSGRYEFVSHQNGTNFKIKRFDNWRLKPQPYLAGIQYKLIQEQAAALAAFSAREIDAVAPNNKLERDQLVQQLGKSVTIDQDYSRSVWMCQTRGDGQWKDPRVNQAISMALDRDEFITLMNFGDGQPSGPVPPAFGLQAISESDLKATWAKKDVTAAKQMLSAAGFDLSKEYELKYYLSGDRPAQFAQIIQSQLAKNLGIKIKLVGEDFGKWLAQSLYGGQYDGFITYPTLSYDDPTGYLIVAGKDIGGRKNWAGYLNDDVDAAWLKQKTILDDKQRNQALVDLQRKLWETGSPYIPTFIALTSTATWNYVKNRLLGRGSYGLFWGQTYIDKS